MSYEVYGITRFANAFWGSRNYAIKPLAVRYDSFDEAQKFSKKQFHEVIYIAPVWDRHGRGN